MSEEYYEGIIYKIRGLNDTTDSYVYIGSTTASLKDRFLAHKRSYRRWKKSQKGAYLASFKVFERYGIENTCIDKLDSVYVDKSELLKLEGKYQERYINCVNIVQNKSEDTFTNTNFCKGQSKIPMEKNIFRNFACTSLSSEF